jgi:hypothetical protein
MSSIYMNSAVVGDGLPSALARRPGPDVGRPSSSPAVQRAAGTAALPPLHWDPFDRLLLAQTNAEGLLLITADQQLADT